MNIGYYKNVHKLPTGEYCAVVKFLFTWGLCVGIDPMGEHHRTRYCYDNEYSAVFAKLTWDGKGDPPGAWITQKPGGRRNPNT